MLIKTNYLFIKLDMSTKTRTYMQGAPFRTFPTFHSIYTKNRRCQLCLNLNQALLISNYFNEEGTERSGTKTEQLTTIRYEYCYVMETEYFTDTFMLAYNFIILLLATG